MVYKAIGLMSGSSLDGLDIAYVHFHETGGKWTYEVICADCFPYSEEWVSRLKQAVSLNSLDYLLLHTAYGRYTGEQVNAFIAAHGLAHKVDLIASHGHTTFHAPRQHMTGQIGDGATIAAVTGLPVVSDLRALDVAFGGQGAPIVPIGEKLLLGDYDFFLNIGGIANLSYNHPQQYLAFDVCPANRVLNLFAQKAGNAYDDNGSLAASGKVNAAALQELNELAYYSRPYPKSLNNDFGTDVVYPLLKQHGLTAEDALATFVEHIATQIRNAAAALLADREPAALPHRLLVTGGGALNGFLISRLRQQLQELEIEVVLPDKTLVEFKEALVMALIGVLRWREEYNVLASVTGAARNSINGALWLGVEA